MDSHGEALEDTINDGIARPAVVGIKDDEGDELKDEFTKVFRLGFFGSEFA